MGKAAYIGVDNVARKIKKGYIGVDNLARKIKKAYIGVGGVARPFWSGGEPEYYGKVDSLDPMRLSQKPASNGSYAIFWGTSVKGWDVYSKELIRTRVTANTSGDQTSGYASAGDENYAVFAGGYSDSNKKTSNTHLINNSLVRSYSLLRKGTAYLTGVSAFGKYLFAGGYTDDGETSECSAFSSNGTLQSAAPISSKCMLPTAGSLSDKAFIISEDTTYRTKYLDVFSEDLTASRSSINRGYIGTNGCELSGSLLIFGGNDVATGTDRVLSISKEGVVSDVGTLSEKKSGVIASSSAGFAIAAGGDYMSLNNFGSSHGLSSVDLFDSNFLRSSLQSLDRTNNSGEMSYGTKIGKYLIINNPKNCEAYQFEE